MTFAFKLNSGLGEHTFVALLTILILRAGIAMAAPIGSKALAEEAKVDRTGQGGTSAPVQFAPFATQISPSFWTALAALKVDRLQLSDDTVPVRAWYTVGKSSVDRTTGDVVHMPASISLDSSSLEHAQASGNVDVHGSGKSAGRNEADVLVEGMLKNFNTVEEFKRADKSALLQKAGADLLHAMMEEEDPTSKLGRFFILSFADLKKYKFIYWFAFPALLAQPAWCMEGSVWQQARHAFDERQLQTIASGLTDQQALLHGFFLIGSDGKIGKIREYETFFDVGTGHEPRTVGFIDPSPLSSTPGWPLRNLLTLLAIRFKVTRIRVLCWRDKLGGDYEKSIIGTVCCKGDGGSQAQEKLVEFDGDRLPLTQTQGIPSQPATVGWERNTAGKLAPKMADLGPLMDPKRLADQAVDLNLKLMRWRILPEIDLEKVQTARCLLLGAGTLGCYVARALLGWGVRHITLVDSSTVSFSNPVRQPLFEFEDCLEGGKPKAKCAADALRRIYPGVRAEGHQLNIPMPGHPIPAASIGQVRKDVDFLEGLFDSHDVVYLLMDSRESRWLPTVLGAAKGKLVLNTALGFDSFLAMRHGASPAQHAQHPNWQRLGCYFCNDVVAPTDSLTDRTLDQMCTVTRPGLAAMASALTVEMTASLLQHPDGILAPAYAPATSKDSAADPSSTHAASTSSILGHLPHQLRGTLFNFQNMLIHGPAYDRCTACSSTVLDAYASQGFTVVQNACNDEAYLRTLTGLDKLYDATDDIEIEWSEGEEDGEEGEGELL